MFANVIQLQNKYIASLHLSKLSKTYSRIQFLPSWDKCQNAYKPFHIHKCVNNKNLISSKNLFPLKQLHPVKPSYVPAGRQSHPFWVIAMLLKTYIFRCWEASSFHSNQTSATSAVAVLTLHCSKNKTLCKVYFCNISYKMKHSTFRIQWNMSCHRQISLWETWLTNFLSFEYENVLLLITVEWEREQFSENGKRDFGYMLTFN